MSSPKLTWYRLTQDVFVASVISETRYVSEDFTLAYEGEGKSLVCVVSQGRVDPSAALSIQDQLGKARQGGDQAEHYPGSSAHLPEEESWLSDEDRFVLEGSQDQELSSLFAKRAYFVFFAAPQAKDGELSLYLQGQKLGGLTKKHRQHVDVFDLEKAVNLLKSEDLAALVFAITNWVVPYFKLSNDAEFLGELAQVVKSSSPKGPVQALPICLDDGLYGLRLPKLSPKADIKDTKFFLLSDEALRPLVVKPEIRTGGQSQDLIFEVPKMMRTRPVVLVHFEKGQFSAWQLKLKESKGFEYLHDRLKKEPDSYCRFLLSRLKRYVDQRPVVKALAQRIVLSEQWDPVGCPLSAAPLAGNLELALALPDGGVLVRGWLFDPLGLVQSWQFESQTGASLSGDDYIHFYKRHDIKDLASHPSYESQDDYGFVGVVPGEKENLPGIGWQLRLQLKGGGELLMKAPRASLNPRINRAQALALVDHDTLTPDLLKKVLVPAASQLHKLCLPEDRVKDVSWFGADKPEAPLYSVVIPLYRTLDYFRHQLAAFYADPDFQDAEIIAVLDSPEQERDFKHMLTGLCMYYDLPIKVVVHHANYGYAPAINSGAKAASGKWLILLNSDVLPSGPGWLSGMVKIASRKGVGLVGPKLLFEDDSLQHAGLYFDKDHYNVWLNRHRFKGYPGDYPDASNTCEVPGVTGACMFLEREFYAALGGTSENYVIGDYEDSDFCLEVRKAGKTIWYAAEVELYHFERRSVRTNTSYIRTNACQINQSIHHERWGETIGKLQDKFAGKLPDTVSPLRR
ncbi:glycosyltransferase family 2 protein [Rhodovibrionaceae bacterium A322]